MKIISLVVLFSLTSVWAARPDNAFSFKENTCVCRNDKPVSKGDCANVCRGKNTKGVNTLFADFAAGSVIANGNLKHVKNWCYKYQIGDSAFPKCMLEVTDQSGNKKQIGNFSFPKNNSFQIDVSSLEDDQSYWLRLVETTSKAGSIPFEIQIFDPIGYPLKTWSLSQYSCYPRTAKELRSHFFYAWPGPVAVPANGNLICHDVAKYGERDDATFPRLDLQTAVAALWNTQNYLFFDNNGDGVLDVNELVVEKIRENGGTVKDNLRMFGVLASPGNRESNYEAGNPDSERLGFVMSYWVDAKNNFQSLCPDEKQFATDVPAFKAMKEIIGRGTEGIYIADRSESELRSYLFVRESDLRAVWFYSKNGVATKPTEEQLQFQTIYFYYPFNKQNPYVKLPHQKVYRVRSVQELPQSLTSLQAFAHGNGEMVSYPSHDRKVACVPKL